MSSLEEDIFFGSRQLALDSYLRAREQLNDDSQLPRRKGITYPNVLDQISYQRSFERQKEVSGSSPMQFQHASIGINDSPELSLTESVYLSVTQLQLKGANVREGTCVELACQLGEMKISQLCFYSAEPMTMSDYFKVGPSYEPVASYFRTIKADCLKVEVSAKDYHYDSKIGSTFVPVESLAVLVHELCQSKRSSLSKRLDHRLLVPKRSKQDPSASISFVLGLSKTPPAPEQPQTFRRAAKEVERQKIEITLHSIDLKRPNNFTVVCCHSKKHAVRLMEPFVVELDRSNFTLNNGLQLQFLADDSTVGVVTLPALHLFLSQEVRGKYPLLDSTTSEYLGCIDMQLTEPVVAAVKHLTATQPSRQPKHSQMVSLQVVSALKILCLSDSDLSLSKFNLLCYRNKEEIRISNDFKFRKTQVPDLYESDQPIDFDYAGPAVDADKVELLIELYKKGPQYDEIWAYSKLEVVVPHSALSSEIEADCSTNGKNCIAKMQLRITTLVCPKGHFNEEKLDRIAAVFHGNTSSKLRGCGAKEVRLALRQAVGLTFIEIDRLNELFERSTEQSLSWLLAAPEQPQAPNINIQDAIKEFEYVDSDRTGYVAKRQFATILGFLGCEQFAAEAYEVDCGASVVDLVFKRRNHQERMVSYLRLLSNSTQRIASPRQQPERHQNIVVQPPRPLTGRIRLLVVRAVNLNTLHEQVKTPNAYILEESTKKSTQVCYRNCNPQFFCEIVIEEPAAEQLRFSIMHKDFRTADLLLAVVKLTVVRLQAATPNQTIRADINDRCHVEFQRR